MARTEIGRDAPPAFAPDELRATVRALRPLAPYMTVENVTPLVMYLASRRCAPTRRVFSVGCGHMARVCIALTRGWYAPGLGNMTPEQVEANLDTACELHELAAPESMNDATSFIARGMPPLGQEDP